MLKKLENEQEFRERVLTGKELKVVIFEAAWSGSSQILIPALERIKTKLNVDITKVCIEQNKEIAMTYGIMKIPTILLFKEQKIIDYIVGINPVIDIEYKITQHLDT